MQKKIRIGAVSYLNTKPLIYGFEQGLLKDEIEKKTQEETKDPNRRAAIQELRISPAEMYYFPEEAEARIQAYEKKKKELNKAQ